MVTGTDRQADRRTGGQADGQMNIGIGRHAPPKNGGGKPGEKENRDDFSGHSVDRPNADRLEHRPLVPIYNKHNYSRVGEDQGTPLRPLYLQMKAAPHQILARFAHISLLVCHTFNK